MRAIPTILRVPGLPTALRAPGLLAALALLGVVLLPGAALAGDAYDARAMVVHIFETADADGDGALTRAEYEAANLQRFGVSFEQSDLDSDGATSQAEYLELYDRHHGGQDRVSL